MNIIKDLRDLGNTMVVVEHEEEIIRSADQVIDIGPGAGELGGKIIFSGDVPTLLQSKESLTAQYLRRELKIATPVFRRSNRKGSLQVKGIRQYNLDLDIDIPLGLMVCVTGVSGSGKSTLVHDIVYAGIKKLQGQWKGPVGRFRDFAGWESITEVMLVDQTPIGRTPRSNPVTYIKAFDEIRRLYSSLRDARSQNLSPAHLLSS